jgi:hypothetical protein
MKDKDKLTIDTHKEDNKMIKCCNNNQGLNQFRMAIVDIGNRGA